jgi:D-amino-acid dehydrogenase
MKVVVVGAGVVGLTTALALVRSGHQVILIDRRREVASEASHGNAGWLGPYMPDPWFGAERSSPWLGKPWRRDSPVSWRPRMQWSQWRWLWQYRKAHGVDLAQLHQSRLSRLLHYSHVMREQWQSSHQLELEMNQGTLQLIRSARDWERWNQWVIENPQDSMAQHLELLDLPALRKAESALSIVPALVGAARWKDDATANCALASRHLKAQCEQAGVSMRTREVVRALLIEGGRIVGVATENGPWRGDAVVLCAGMDCLPLVRQVKIKLPLETIHGFSATVNLAPDARGLRHAVVEPETMLTMTPMSGRVRISGGFHLDRRTGALPAPVVRILMNQAADWLPGAARYSDATYWYGQRVMTPDGLPLLGPLRPPGLWLNTGHGHWGFALSWGSAQVLADMISGQTPAIALDGLTADRYSP